MRLPIKMLDLAPGKRITTRRFAYLNYRTTGVIRGVEWCSWDGCRVYVEFDCKPGERPMWRTVRVDQLAGVPRLAKRV